MLNKIKFSYKVADEQKNLFTTSHTLFKCKIKIDGLQYTFNYQCNTSVSEPNLHDCLECLIEDMYAYEDSRDLIDFINEYGYETETGALKAWKECKKVSKALHRLFSEEEFEELETEIREGY